LIATDVLSGVEVHAEDQRALLHDWAALVTSVVHACIPVRTQDPRILIAG
jgi:hypothetical protein